ncbi:uncharacterized protein LOC129741987 [Uranotaenia lowii]|uniref:uncharacterized protein LOC129741987 n=1 Tax=Uranotaenia lowii TaxID=190385 RepID=UPI0024793C4F|nr:uncharacterized protein LOC129741987 [Uranotaenia lowii]
MANNSGIRSSQRRCCEVKCWNNRLGNNSKLISTTHVPLLKISKRVKSQSTNKSQFSRMVEVLEQHPDVAKGFSKYDGAPVWDQIAQDLNSLGPPEKDSTAWKKVWSDLKSNLKKKLSHNRQEQRATGGGPNKMCLLTDLEERIAALAGLTPAVEGIEGTSSFGIASENISGIANDASVELALSDEEETQEDTRRETTRRKRPLNQSMELLKEQVQQQGQFHGDVWSCRAPSMQRNLFLRTPIVRSIIPLAKLCLLLKVLSRDPDCGDLCGVMSHGSAG